MSVPIPTLRIGEHRGKKFNQVHPDYLRGLLRFPDLWEETRTQIEFYLKTLENAKKERLDYNPVFYKKTTPPVRTEAGKERFRELSRQAKEKVFGDA